MFGLTRNNVPAILYSLVVLMASVSIYQQSSVQYSAERHPIYSDLKSVAVSDVTLHETNVVSDNESEVVGQQETFSLSHYTELTLPNGIGKSKYFETLFEEVSTITGASKIALMYFAATESSFNPAAKASARQKRSNYTAQGLFQFTSDHWKFVTKRYGKPYGVSANTDRLDPRANALMAGFHLMDNAKLIQDKAGVVDIGLPELYITHLLGRTGSVKFFNFDSDVVISRKMPAAAKGNKPFFYKGKKALTRDEVYEKITHHLLAKAKEFEING